MTLDDAGRMHATQTSDKDQRVIKLVRQIIDGDLHQVHSVFILRFIVHKVYNLLYSFKLLYLQFRLRD